MLHESEVLVLLMLFIITEFGFEVENDVVVPICPPGGVVAPYCVGLFVAGERSLQQGTLKQAADPTHHD